MHFEKQNALKNAKIFILFQKKNNSKNIYAYLTKNFHTRYPVRFDNELNIELNIKM